MGFSLIELMVALALGLLLSVGIVTLFGATSKTNKVQDSLARLQENGRYAITRINADLRMLGGEYCNSISSVGWTSSADNGPQYPGAAIYANVIGVSNITSSKAFPDSGGTAGLPPTGWTAGTVYPVSPATFMRGYECDLGGGCTPAVPSSAGADGLPAEGTTDGTRVRGADVLTIRYQRGTGWPFTVTGTGAGAVITLQPTIVGGAQTDDPVNIVNGDRVLLTTCGGGMLFQANAAGNVITPAPGTLLSQAAFQPSAQQGGGSFDVRAFNFDRDFVTITYYLAWKSDPNPDQPGRVVPVLMRKVNGSATPDEIVQGVERLDFFYGVQFRDGSFRYLTADEVEANSDVPQFGTPPPLPANCPPPPPEWDTQLYGNVEPNCLWRSVKSVEVHMLIDSVDNVYDLALADTAYRYTVDDADMTLPPDSPTADMVYGSTGTNGSKAGRMMRREFVSMVATRNGNH
jgi:type IV pilus assembly protein PilW